jgi:hypothetical protein
MNPRDRLKHFDVGVYDSMDQEQRHREAERLAVVHKIFFDLARNTAASPKDVYLALRKHNTNCMGCFK